MGFVDGMHSGPGSVLEIRDEKEEIIYGTVMDKQELSTAAT